MAASHTPSLAPQPPAAAGAARRPVSRRELLVAGLAGGAALVTTNVYTGLVTNRLTASAAERRARTELEALQKRHETTVAGLEAELRRLERQLSLYRDLERVGLDRLIHAALDLYDRLWAAVRTSIELLRRGLRAVNDGLVRFEGGLSALRSAAQVVAGLLAGIEAQVDGVEEIVGEVLKLAAPVGEAVGGFFSWLLSKIPFGVGARIREASDRISALAGAVPALVADTRERLVEPLRKEWLAAGEGEGLQGALFDPLRARVLLPLDAHLSEVERMASQWETEVARPLRAALVEREKVRKEIARLEREPRTTHSGS